MFFQKSAPELDPDRSQDELYERLRGIGVITPEFVWKLGWTGVSSGMTRTNAMAVLAQPKDHKVLIKALTQLQEGSNMYPIIQQWVPTPIIARTANKGP